MRIAVPVVNVASFSASPPAVAKYDHRERRRPDEEQCADDQRPPVHYLTL